MKILVIYSGEVRTLNNIEHNNAYWPEGTDIVYTTWERNKQTYGIIDHFFKEPKPHYNCEAEFVKSRIKWLRDHPDAPESEKNTARQFIKEWRVRGRYRIVQHLAHAMAVEKLADDYDIVIRIRYDAKFYDEIQPIRIHHLIEMSHKTGMPIGLCHGWSAPSGDQGNGMYFHDMEEEVKWALLGDFIIIHPRNIFEPEKVYKLYKEKKLASGEHGWWQILCDGQPGFFVASKTCEIHK